MLGLSLGYMREKWRVVRGKDGLAHWHCTAVPMHDENDETFDEDETTWCGQTFFERESPLNPEANPVTCIECAARKDA